MKNCEETILAPNNRSQDNNCIELKLNGITQTCQQRVGLYKNSHPVLTLILYQYDKPILISTNIKVVHLHVCMLIQKTQYLPVFLAEYAIESNNNSE